MNAEGMRTGGNYKIAEEKKSKENAEKTISESYAREGEYNYVSMGYKHGKYKIEPEKLYEIISAGKVNEYCFVEQKTGVYKLFYDIDIKNNKFIEEEIEEIAQINVEEIKEKIIEMIGAVLKEYCGIEGEYIYSTKKTTSGTEGNAYKLHIYYPKIEVNNKIANFIRWRVIDKLEKWKLRRKIWEGIIDECIYKGNGLRLLYQMKKGEEEAYVINESKSTYEYIPRDRIGRLRITSIRTGSANPNIKIIKGEIEKNEEKKEGNREKELKKGKEMNVEKEDCGEVIRAYFKILSEKRIRSYETWKNIMMYCRNNGYYEMAHEVSKRVDNYNSKMIDEIFKKPSSSNKIGIGSLMQWAREDNIEEYNRIRAKYGNEYIYKNINDIFMEKYGDRVDYKETERYISGDAYKEIKKHNRVLIQSGTGTGKSCTIEKILKEEKGKNILCIESIRTLARSHERTFEEIDIKCYLEHEESERYIISLEQLYRMKNKYDIVVLDEISNLFEHMYSKTMNKTRRKSFEKLIDLMIHAEKVICADANVRDDVMSQLDELYGKELFYYKNEYKCSKGVKVKVMTCKKGSKVNKIYNFLKPLREKLIAKKSICISSDSKEVCLIAERCIKKLGWCGSNIMMYTSGQGNTQDIIECNRKWLYKVVIFSPKIVYGVDNQIEYEEGTICGIYTGKSISSINMFQQLGRCRKAKDMRILWLQQEGEKTEYATYDGVCAIENEKYINYAKNVNMLNKDINTEGDLLSHIGKRGKELDKNALFYEYHCRRAWYNTIFRNGKLKLLRDLLENQGYEVTTEELMIEDEANFTEAEIRAENTNKEIMSNKKFMGDKLTPRDTRYESTCENMKNKIKYLGVTKNDIKEEKMLEDIVTTKGVLEKVLLCNELNMNGEELTNKYTAQYDKEKKMDLYGVFEMDSVGICRNNTLKKIEEICGITRNRIEDININKIVVEPTKFVEEIEKIKNDVGEVLYHNCGKRKRDVLINNKIKKMKNEKDIRVFIANMYNTFGKIIKIKRNHKKNGDIEFAINDDMLKKVNKIRELIRKKNENIEYAKKNKWIFTKTNWM